MLWGLDYIKDDLRFRVIINTLQYIIININTIEKF